jgi:hypothetical protein
MLAQKQHITQDLKKALLSIDYHASGIKQDYYFTDFFSKKSELKKVDLAIFGQEPIDYRSACISFNFWEDQDSKKIKDTVYDYRALGAPNNFII